MRHRDMAEAPFSARHGRKPLIIAAVLSPLKRGDKLLHHIVYVHKFKLRRGVVDRDGQIAGGVIAERGDGAVVIRSAPLSEHIRKAVNEHRSAGALSVGKKQPLPCELRPAVVRAGIAPGEACLRGA